jgi:ABC-type microcin C transport system duplicated ATPase subunit YejF
VSLEIGRARTLALVGESGCGKTTLGKAIVQLLRGQARIEGQALLDGRDLFALQGDALRAARREVQIVFQDPFASLNPRLRVHELLQEGLQALRPELARRRGARASRTWPSVSACSPMRWRVTRTSSPAASASASPSRVRWRCSPGC